jgi:hypothetical protein
MVLLVVVVNTGGGVAVAVCYICVWSLYLFIYLFLINACNLRLFIYLFVYFSLMLATLRLWQGLQNYIYNRDLSIILGPRWALSQYSCYGVGPVSPNFRMLYIKHMLSGPSDLLAQGPPCQAPPVPPPFPSDVFLFLCLYFLHWLSPPGPPCPFSSPLSPLPPSSLSASMPPLRASLP